MTLRVATILLVVLPKRSDHTTLQGITVLCTTAAPQTYVLAVGTGDHNYKHSKLRLHAVRDLPEGCYEVKRLIAKRRRKIISTVIFMCLVCMCLVCMCVYACVWGVCICRSVSKQVNSLAQWWLLEKPCWRRLMAKESHSSECCLLVLLASWIPPPLQYS